VMPRHEQINVPLGDGSLVQQHLQQLVPKELFQCVGIVSFFWFFRFFLNAGATDKASIPATPLLQPTHWFFCLFAFSAMPTQPTKASIPATPLAQPPQPVLNQRAWL